jgi:hypothetical protein
MKFDNWEKKLDAEVYLKREMEKTGKGMGDSVASDEDTAAITRDGVASQVAPAVPERPTYGRQTFERAMAAGLRDPRFASWSRRGKCVLVLLRETTPKFSMSDMVAEYLEQGLERDHPDLLKKVDEHLKTLDTYDLREKSV